MVNYDVLAIDTVMNPHTLEGAKIRAEQSDWAESFLAGQIKSPMDIVKGVELPRLIDLMDEAGIEKAFLIAAKLGPKWNPVGYRYPNELVIDIIQKYPDRFYGLAGIDYYERMDGIRELEKLVKTYGFIGAHLYPHWFELPPDSAKYYPFYAKCVELDIPIQMQVGQCRIYSERYPLRSVGRPITLDTIACDFPELKLIGIHVGYPWTEEMISVANKHKNVYIGTDAYAPKYLPKSLVHFINTYGQDKVLFGTDYPVIPLKRARDEIEQFLELRPGPKRKFLRENAIRVYGLAIK